MFKPHHDIFMSKHYHGVLQIKTNNSIWESQFSLQKFSIRLLFNVSHGKHKICLTIHIILQNQNEKIKILDYKVSQFELHIYN